MFRIVHHFEPGFAFDAYPPGISCEQGGIFELRTGIQPNGRAVRKRHPYMLAGRYGHGQPLRTLLFQSAGFPIIITADKKREDCRSRAPAAQQHARTPSPVLFVEFVDERGAQCRQIVPPMYLGKQPLMFG